MGICHDTQYQGSKEVLYYVRYGFDKSNNNCHLFRTPIIMSAIQNWVTFLSTSSLNNFVLYLASQDANGAVLNVLAHIVVIHFLAIDTAYMLLNYSV